MAKKSSFLRNLKRSRKTAPKTLRVESLESRQLYAVVTGAGEEVVSDKVNPDGVTYDQILMTGSAVSVTNDAGQVTRVSFLDKDGDIVQVALVGNGTLNVSLDGAQTGVTPSNYNTAAQAYKYVQGDATITITGSDAGTSLEVYSVGAARNPGVVDATHQGGDHWADLQRVIIVGNEKNEAGYTNFGSIRTGNAYFSADTGVVGIRAENVAVQGQVRIGDIDASGSGVPTLYFNSNSQFQTVFVQGGDLAQSNGASFDSFGNGNPGGTGNSSSAGGVSLGGFAFFNSIMGQDSQGNYLMATPVNQDAIRLAAVDQQTLMTGDWTVTLDAAGKVAKVENSLWHVDAITGKLVQGAGEITAAFGLGTSAQDSLDAVFDRRAFSGSITIDGDLKAGLEINAAKIGGSITFEDNLYGRLVVDGFGAEIGGTLNVKGDLDGSVLVRGLDRVTGGTDGQENEIGAILVGGKTGSFTDVRAETIGDIKITGNFSGLISTNVYSTFGNYLSVPTPDQTTWNGTQRTGTTFVDVEGKIGNVTVGQKADGTSNGGSIVNGTIQGMSGIGNVWVGGDIWGSAPGSGVFVTSSNAGAAPTDVRAYGSANVGNITVIGDVDLDSSSLNFIHINENGTFGNITVKGEVTADTQRIIVGYTEKPVFVQGSEQLQRILSPFTDIGFTADATKGELLIQNYDPDQGGPLNSDYIVTADDVTAGAKVYDVKDDGTVSATQRAAVAGERVPVVVNGAAVKDALGNVLYYQNTAFFKGEFVIEKTPIYENVVKILSGNRGNLNGVYNNFGKITIDGLLGAQQQTTGTISWTDSVDMDFGGITVGSQGTNNQQVIGSAGTVGQITISNTGYGVASLVDDGANGKKLVYEYATLNASGVPVANAMAGQRADLNLSGTIGAPSVGTANDNTAFVGLDGLKVEKFEDVAVNGAITAAKINNGIDIKTVAGVGNGTGASTISPSVLFNKLITLADGTAETEQTALLKVDVGMTNSFIGFGEIPTGVTSSANVGSKTAGIVVSDGSGKTGQSSVIADISLTADYVAFDGILQAGTIGNLAIKGGTGILSGSDTAISFTPEIRANKVGTQTFESTSGIIAINEAVAPLAATNPARFTAMGDITATSAFGNIDFNGNYQANLSNITLATADKTVTDHSGKAEDNVGSITINGVVGFNTVIDTNGQFPNAGLPGGNVGNIKATTTGGSITNSGTGLVIRGNAGTLDLATGVSAGKTTGSINFTETIYGTRGVTTLDTVTGKSGNITANLNYAGAFVGDAATDALVVKSNGTATINLTVGQYDDNRNGVISASEIGHGGNTKVTAADNATVNVYSAFTEAAIHTATLGNLVVEAPGKTATIKYQGVTGLNAATSKPESSSATTGTAGFEGAIGNITASGAAVVFSTGTQINGTRGKILATATGSGGITGELTLNGEVDATNADAVATAFEGQSNGNKIELTFANTSGDVGNVKLNAIGISNNVGAADGSNKWTGGDIKLTGNIAGKIGNVDLTTHSTYDIKNGSVDEQKNAGNITIVGTANVNKGTWKNITAVTDVGTISMYGMFGTIGDVTMDTTTYTDLDFAPNAGAPEPIKRVLEAGNIRLQNNEAQLKVSGTHGKFDLEVAGIGANSDVNSSGDAIGTIEGNVIFSGAQTGTEGIIAKTEAGKIDLKLTLANDGGMSNDGTVGSINLESTKAGDITLALTTQNSAVGDYNAIATSLYSNFSVGQITAKTGHWNSLLADVKDKAADVKEVGDITITGIGVGGWTNPLTAGGVSTIDPNYLTAPIFRGAVAGIDATVTAGDIKVSGDFGNVGNVNLTAGQYLDASANTDGKKQVDAGTITLGFESGRGYTPLGIWGTSGTITLDTNDKGGEIAALGDVWGTIEGSLRFGGQAQNTDSLVATSERGDINLKVFAAGIDTNNSGKGDGRVTDGVDRNITGPDEFAHVGNVKIETFDSGNVTFAAGLISMDNSQIGPSIGAITLTANDDLYTVNDKAVDTFIAPNVTFTGMTSLGGFDVKDGLVTIAKKPIDVSPDGKGQIAIAGTIGDVTMTVATGTANLRGNFVDLGAVTIATGTYTDTSINAANDDASFGGDIKLGDGNSATTAADLQNYADTLNIAGSYESSSLTVQEDGTITGSVHVAGDGGNDWTLSVERGVFVDAATDYRKGIDVGFVAGFNADGSGSGIDADEVGLIGNVDASSSVNANVFIGVGGKADASKIGNVTVSTGDVAEIRAGKYDLFAVTAAGVGSGDTKVTGLGGLGTVGDITGTVVTGVAGLAGTFGNVGTIKLRTDAVLDTDWSSEASEDVAIVKSGDINLNATQIWGTHGLVDLKTVDTSKLPAAQAGVIRWEKYVNQDGAGANPTDDLGNMEGSITFSGGLASGVTTGFKAVSDRGTINVGAQAGNDEDGQNNYSANEAGTVGNVEVSSTDGDVTVDVTSMNWDSTVGNVSATTGDTWQAWNRNAVGLIAARYTDDLVASGDAKVTFAQGVGSLGNVTVSAQTGMATLLGVNVRNVGDILVKASNYTDATPALGAPAAVVKGGDVSATGEFFGNVGSITLTAIDDAANGNAALGANAGTVTGSLTFSTVAGATVGPIKATSQQGNITLGVAAEQSTWSAGPNKYGVDNDVNTAADDLIGAVGSVEATSLYGTIAATLNTDASVTNGGVTRTPTIGNVKLATGTSWRVAAGPGNDTAVLTGGITITGTSAGILGNVEATTTTGAIGFSGTYNNTVGNIKLSSSEYSDGGTLMADGDITFAGTFAANQSTKVGTIDLSTLGAGTITIKHTADVAWDDSKVDNSVTPNITANDGTIQDGEQRTFSSGKLTATAVDGLIAYQVDIGNLTGAGNEKEGYGSKLDATELKTTGNGGISITGSNVAVSEIVDFKATSAKGFIAFTNGSTWDATKISSVDFTAGSYVSTVAGTRIGLNFANATNNQATNASLESLKFTANDGNVLLGGDITAFADNAALIGNAKVAYVATSLTDATAKNADNRTFTFKNLEFTAKNGALDATVNDGNIQIAGKIGGAEVTKIDSIVFNTPTPTDDIILLNATAGTNIQAHDIGTLTFNGNTVMGGTYSAAGVDTIVGTGDDVYVAGAANIVADDYNTVREVVGTKHYWVGAGVDTIAGTADDVHATSTATVQGAGSNLDSITALVFNGAAWGKANTLTGVTGAEIKASQIGTLTINANVDPSYTFKTTVQDLDVLVSNGTGEFVAANAATAGSGAKYSQMSAFAIGDVTINHKLAAPAGTTSVFGGTGVISSLGGLGNLTINSTVNGDWQAPLFAAGANGSAYFIVGDGDANIGVNTAVVSNVVLATTGGHAMGATTDIGAKLNVGNVTINAASTTNGASPQDQNLGNAGGGVGATVNNQGFVLAVGAVGAAGVYGPGSGAAAINAYNSVTGVGIYGHIGTIDGRNAGTRPDTDSVGGFGATASTGGSTIVVAGDNTTAIDVDDIINDLDNGAVRPLNDTNIVADLNDGDNYVIGDVAANDEDAISIYVL